MKRDLSWQKQAACRNIPAFLDDSEEHGWTNAQRKRLCKGEVIDGTEVTPPCAVKYECLEYAMTFTPTENAHRGLMFGGLTGFQVAKLQRRMRDAAEAAL